MVLSSRFGSISPKSFIVTVLIILLVIGLFFIPEIISFQKSLFGHGGGRSVHVPEERTAANQNKPDDGSSLDDVQNLLNAPNARNEQPALPSTQVSKFSLPKFFDRSTWAPHNTTAGNPGNHAIASTLHESQNILKSLPPDKNDTRYALLNFINALSRYGQYGNSGLTQEQTALYLQELQNKVSSAMLRENIDVGTYNNFVALSLGAKVDSARDLRLAAQLRPFNPRLTLMNVTMGRAIAGTANISDLSGIWVQATGSVIGDDVYLIHVYYNGNFFQVIKPRVSNALGLRTFMTRRWNGRGIYTFRVYDKLGQVWEKSYSFYPKARVFRHPSGAYEIPPAAPFDSRLDDIFTFRRGRLVERLRDSGDLGQTFERF